MLSYRPDISSVTVPRPLKSFAHSRNPPLSSHYLCVASRNQVVGLAHKVIIPVIMVLIVVIIMIIIVIIMVIIMLNNFCFHVNAQKCQVVGLSGCQVAKFDSLGLGTC